MVKICTYIEERSRGARGTSLWLFTRKVVGSIRRRGNGIFNIFISSLASLSSATQYATPPEFVENWRAECLNSLPTIMRNTEWRWKKEDNIILIIVYIQTHITFFDVSTLRSPSNCNNKVNKLNNKLLRYFFLLNSFVSMYPTVK